MNPIRMTANQLRTLCRVAYPDGDRPNLAVIAFRPHDVCAVDGCVAVSMPLPEDAERSFVVDASVLRNWLVGVTDEEHEDELHGETWKEPARLALRLVGEELRIARINLATDEPSKKAVAFVVPTLPDVLSIEPWAKSFDSLFAIPPEGARSTCRFALSAKYLRLLGDLAEVFGLDGEGPVLEHASEPLFPINFLLRTEHGVGRICAMGMAVEAFGGRAAIAASLAKRRAGGAP